MRANPAAEWLGAICSAAEDPAAVPTTAVVVAHPDDEVVGLGGHLPDLRHAAFVYVTDGAPRNGRDAAAHGFASTADYAAARRRELLEALAMAGIASPALHPLGCADQEASACLADLSRRLAELLGALRPAVVVTHAYEGGHPDHDATAFAVHAACDTLGQAGGPAPHLIEAAAYHNGPNGIETACFLPGGEVEAVSVALSPAQAALKRRLIECFVSQQETLRHFRVDVECFRPAPRYDFTQPPHPGRLFYEQFDWGMTGEHFRDLARRARRALGLSGGDVNGRWNSTWP